MQADIANIINGHLKRERKLMPRKFPADLLEADQTTFINAMNELFVANQPAFNSDKFREICMDGV